MVLSIIESQTLKEGNVLKALEELESAKNADGWVWKDFEEADAIAESLCNPQTETVLLQEVETQKAYAQ